MSSESPRELSAAEQDQVNAWLAEADAASKAEDWDKAITLYRKALEFDRYLQGGEAKLQWALRMRDIDKLYRDGQAKLDAGDYEGALVPLRKARVMYASHYKDVDDLILKAQAGLQQEKWEARPEEAKSTGKRNPIFFIGVIAIVIVGLALIALQYIQSTRNASLNTPETIGAPAVELSSKIPTVSGTTTTTPSGLQITVVQPGSGAEAVKGKTVDVHYTGYLLDGAQFDSSIGRAPLSFVLGAGRVIPGWEEGIEGMKVGEKRRLIVPAALGYGAQGFPPVIPPNATLVFDVELVNVQ